MGVQGVKLTNAPVRVSRAAAAARRTPPKPKPPLALGFTGAARGDSKWPNYVRGRHILLLLRVEAEAEAAHSKAAFSHTPFKKKKERKEASNGAENQ